MFDALGNQDTSSMRECLMANRPLARRPLVKSKIALVKKSALCDEERVKVIEAELEAAGDDVFLFDAVEASVDREMRLCKVRMADPFGSLMKGKEVEDEVDDGEEEVEEEEEVDIGDGEEVDDGEEDDEGDEEVDDGEEDEEGDEEVDDGEEEEDEEGEEDEEEGEEEDR